MFWVKYWPNIPDQENNRIIFRLTFTHINKDVFLTKGIQNCSLIISIVICAFLFFHDVQNIPSPAVYFLQVQRTRVQNLATSNISVAEPIPVPSLIQLLYIFEHIWHLECVYTGLVYPIFRFTQFKINNSFNS